MTNHPIHWLYQQHIGEVPTGSAWCYLCGVSCPEQYSVIKGIADTFNSHYLAKCPSSPWLCSACQWYFNGNRTEHADFRKMSLYVGKDGWENWERPLMKPLINHWLNHGLPTAFYLICSLSKKKHILLQAPLNAKGAMRLAIQVEEQVAHVEYATWDYMDRRFMALLQMGHNKGEILSGQLYGNTLKKHQQIANALVLSQELEPYRNSAALELLSYVTIIEQGENDVTGNDATTATDGTLASGGTAPESGMESNRPRVQEQVSDRHLDAIRVKRPGVCEDEQHPGEVSQRPLW